VDDDAGIRKFAEHSLTNLLLTKSPHRFHSHFVETVFFLNGCTEHATFNQFERNGGVYSDGSDDKDDEELGDVRASAKRRFAAAAAADAAAMRPVLGGDEEADARQKELRFAFRGSAGAPKRFAIYKYLLRFLGDEHKFQTAGKLVMGVLGSLVDGKLPINDSTSDVIKDTLVILSSKHIKMTAIKRGSSAGAGGAGDDDDDDAFENEDGAAAAAAGNMAAVAALAAAGKAKIVAAERGKFLSKISKKNTMENISTLNSSFPYFLSLF
jgi:hypothetical protein